MINRIISSSRAIYYSIYEPLQLRKARRLFEEKETDDSRPMISVYCPTYNRCDLLQSRAIRSVLNQTYDNFEFIIIGDHCTDGTTDMVLSEMEKDPRIRYYNLQKRGYRYPPTRDNHWFAGPVVAANIGLSQCKGDWIARIDDDDIWTKDHLQVLLEFILWTGDEFVSSAYVEERYGKRKTIHFPGKMYVGGTSSWLYRSYLKFFKYNIDCWRKSDFRVNDLDLAYRMIKAGVKRCYYRFPTYEIIPRTGEETIGSEVYRKSKNILEHYKFDA